MNFSNKISSTVDFTEKSLEDLLEQIRGMKVAIKPTHYVIPPWVQQEIAAQFGEVTEENYIRWWRKRLGLER